MQITLKTKISGAWQDVPVEPEGEARHNQIKALHNTESIMEIVSHVEDQAGNLSELKEYYCGTEVLFEKMCKMHKDSDNYLIITGESFPDLKLDYSKQYDIVVRSFFGPKDVEIALPPKPDYSKGWEHLREKE